MIRLLIVDDDATSRRGIQNMIGSDPEIAIVGSLSKGEEAVDFCNHECPDVILMDISMPSGMSGVEAAREIKASNPGVKVVFLSLGIDLSWMKECPHDGYLLKESMDRSIKFTLAVKSAYYDIKTYSPEVLAEGLLQCTQRASTSAPLPQEVAMTALEARILSSLVAGWTYAQIAAELNYSDGYIRTVANKLMTRMQLKNVKELVVWGARRGI